MIRSDILRVYKAVHTWVGILAGLALFIAFFAGALTIFEQPIARWLTPPSATLPALSFEQADIAIQHTVHTHPDAAKALVVHINDSQTEPSPLRWSADGEWQSSLNGNSELLAEEIPQSDFAQFIDQLHQTAGIPGKLGHEHLGVYFMGIVSALYFIALISGLIILLPTFTKDFLALRRGKNNKRFWLDAHNVIGVSAYPFHLVIAFTAIVFAFHDPFYGALQKIVYGEKPLFSPPAITAIDNQSVEKLLPVSTLLEKIAITAPAFKVREIDYRNLNSPKALARIAGTGEGHIVRGPHYGYLLMQPYSGEIINKDMLPGEMETWTGIVSSFFALHFGNYGGNFVRWLYFFLGLSGAFLFFSGNLLWIESRRKRLRLQNNSVQQNRSSKILAALTIGIPLGAVAGVGISLVAAKWLQGFVADINGWLSAIYYLVFIVCIGWSFWHGAAKAAYSLAYVCAGIYVLIPLTTVLNGIFSALPGWANTASDSIGVDITALTTALLFFYAARLTQRRALHGSTDSVWSVYSR